MKLYGDSENFRTKKVLAAAKLADKQLTLVQGAPSLNSSPFGLIPTFEDGKVALFGAEAISKYLLKDSQYLPKKLENEVDQWLYWAEGQLLPNVLCYVLPCVSAVKMDAEKVKIAKEELFAQLAIFDQLLSTRTFIEGERLTFADISLAFNLIPAYQFVLGSEARSSFKNITRYFMTVINQPSVKDVFASEFKLIDQPASFNDAEYEKIKAKIVAKTEAQPAKAKGTEKKEEKKDDMDMSDEAIASEPKFEDPLAALPAGKFVMDGFKRVYSNEDTATKAIPYFWENFDAENYSIWYCEYKYPEELKQVFMSCNLITGMFQRLDKLRKYAFGSVCLFGTDNNSTISGVWIWRGQKLAFELSPDWQIDYDVYDWKKLDPSKEEVKKLVNEYFMWEGDFGGKKVNQGKIFK